MTPPTPLVERVVKSLQKPYDYSEYHTVRLPKPGGGVMTPPYEWRV